LRPGPPHPSSHVHALGLAEADVISEPPPSDSHEHAFESAVSLELPAVSTDLPDTDCNLDFYSAHWMFLPLTLMNSIFPMALALPYLFYFSLLGLTLLMSLCLHLFMQLFPGLIFLLLLLLIKPPTFLSPMTLMMIMVLCLNHKLTLLLILSLSLLPCLLILPLNTCMHLISICRTPALISAPIMISPCHLLLDHIFMQKRMLDP